MNEDKEQLRNRLATVRAELIISRSIELGIAFFCGYHFAECLKTGYYLPALGMFGIAIVNAIAAYLSRIGARGEEAKLREALFK